jgi:hypothetical protein
MIHIPKFMKELMIALFCAPFVIQAAIVLLPDILAPIFGLILLGVLAALIVAPIAAAFVLWRRLPNKHRSGQRSRALPPRGVKTIKRPGSVNRTRKRR